MENKEKKDQKDHDNKLSVLQPTLVGSLADEIAKIVVDRIPQLLKSNRKKRISTKSAKRMEKAIFLDTSAIIDGRIFDVITLGVAGDTIVVFEPILLELKHIADLQDAVKRERGRNGLNALDKIKKARGIKVIVLPEEAKNADGASSKEVDEKLIFAAKVYKGRIVTCDYNLAKKASIQNVLAINVNELANCLKIRAVPGESVHIKLLHQGKDATQGVGYLDDGTMIVVEKASSDVGKMVDVVVSRVIQTSAGRILFAKMI